MGHEPKHEPQGALRQPDGSILWRIWAPSQSVSLVTWIDGRREELPMASVGFGYQVATRPRVPDGARYAYQLADGHEYPDPASRWQPDGVHRPSAVFSPELFGWSDQQWHGVPRRELVIYELHVGTFTPEGTFDAIVGRLPDLVGLGVTALELMPVAQFPGERNWGYDGVHPSAAQNSYGGPQGLQRLIDAAHRHGVAVLLDVVYNHLGPEGNYFGRFGPYFTDRYHTPWGSGINFDGPDSDPVRQFVIDNARMWVRDFHADGLRLDAVHSIFDFSARHILADIQAAVQKVAAEQNRIVHVIAETSQNDVRLTDPPAVGGFGLDGAWADDFHHSIHTLLTGERDGYYQDFGRPEQLTKALNDVFVYDGCYSVFRRRRHGSRVENRDRTQFVVDIQTHDQVGNRARGDRLATLVPPEAQRLACGLLMLSPCVPLLFMGEEYGETRPFPFFCSFQDRQLIEAVRLGRQKEFANLAFQWQGQIPDAQDPATFAAAKLQWSWPEGASQARLRQLYQDLLAARRRWAPLQDRRATSARLSDERGPNGNASAVLIVERGRSPRIIACANLAPQSAAAPELQLAGETVILTTEDSRYGGKRTGDQPTTLLHPYEMLIFGPAELRL